MVTEETKEIMDVATVLTAFMRHGIYRFKFDAITEAMPYGLLANLKRETFSRWMRNPLYQYMPNLESWQFKYGKRVTFFTKKSPDIYGLEESILMMGYENFVRWLRVWSSNYAAGAESNPEAVQSLENEITRIYVACSGISRSEGHLKAIKQGAKELEAVWHRACEIKGRPDYMSTPIEPGRKTTIYISRNTKNTNKDTYDGGDNEISEL